jgi:hypothetical protein
MITFKEFLAEAAEGKNLHLEHLEDEVFNHGVSGARDSILFLRSLRDMLAGHAHAKMTVTTKFDGAPAIFAGINPENGKFFVGTKSVFSKGAKLNYTAADVDRNHGHSAGLAKKLKIALEFLPKLGIRGVWQGDVMFTREDLQVNTMDDGKKYLTFQPNTIVYAVPLDSQLARTMQRAHIGVVWHTQYIGEKLEDMKATFMVNMNQLDLTPDVWFRDARFVDASGSATFTAEETQYITRILSAAGTLFYKMNPHVLNYIAQNDTIRNQIKTFNNSRIRQGQPMGDPQKHVGDLMIWVNEKANKHILDAKQEPTRRKREFEKTELIRFYRANFTQLIDIFSMVAYLIDAKNFIIRKLQNVKGMGTFLRTEYGFKVTAPEGFVAIDHEGKAVKLVDRLEFSRANFNAAKAWDQ